MNDISGQLPSLFSGEELPVEFILYYLYKHEAPGVQAFLINKLYEVPPVIDYLPQLVNISMQREDFGAYRSYFLDTSIKSHVFAMKLYWLLQANLYDCPKNYTTKLENILHDLERVIVNGQKHATDSEYHPPHLFDLDIVESDKDIFAHKRARADYFSDQHKLAYTLAKLSIALIAVPNEDKDPTLRAYIQNVDTWIKDTRFWYNRSEYSAYTRRMYRGIVLPIEFNGEKRSIEQIVAIPSIESRCFKTKARVPYKIIIETIDINEEEIIIEPGNAETEHRTEIIDGFNVDDIEDTLEDKNTIRFEGFAEFARSVRPDKSDRPDYVSTSGSDSAEENP